MPINKIYKDCVLDSSKNTKMKFKKIENEDGSCSFEDLTNYSDPGTDIDSSDFNTIVNSINTNENNIS